jgi:hypothetical protein
VAAVVSPGAAVSVTGCMKARRVLDGGREALNPAQRFPDDFDGIIAGASAGNLAAFTSPRPGWSAASGHSLRTTGS